MQNREQWCQVIVLFIVESSDQYFQGLTLRCRFLPFLFFPLKERQFDILLNHVLRSFEISEDFV